MNPVDFIHKNIVKQLLADGYPNDLAISGARKGVDHYLACSQASRIGAMYDDCLYYARQHAYMQTPKREQVKKPVKTARRRVKQAGGLFG